MNPLTINSVHHIAIITSDYVSSKKFYCEILGLEVLREVYREQRNSYKCDLAINGHYVVELFSFPEPAVRPSYPEATGLRHLAFAVENLEVAIAGVEQNGISCEPIRVDEYTGKRFTFFADPDGLPIEFYEI